MVRHQNIDRTNHAVAGAGVQKNEQPLLMEGRREPTGRTVFHRQGPVHEGTAAVKLGGKSREVALFHSLVLVATK